MGPWHFVQEALSEKLDAVQPILGLLELGTWSAACQLKKVRMPSTDRMDTTLPKGRLTTTDDTQKDCR